MNDGRRLKSLDMLMLDAAPLIAYVNGLGGFREVCSDVNLQRRWDAVRKRGTISVSAADRICIKGLGINPAVVFGELWWQVDDWTAPKRKAG